MRRLAPALVASLLLASLSAGRIGQRKSTGMRVGGAVAGSGLLIAATDVRAVGVIEGSASSSDALRMR